MQAGSSSTVDYNSERKVTVEEHYLSERFGSLASSVAASKGLDSELVGIERCIISCFGHCYQDNWMRVLLRGAFYKYNINYQLFRFIFINLLK